MGWMLGLASYLVIWWVLLFAVLPFGVVSQHEAKDVVHGSDPGAPHRPQLLKKVLITTVAAALVWGLVDLAYIYFYLGR